jgi:hypothetical protein
LEVFDRDHDRTRLLQSIGDAEDQLEEPRPRNRPDLDRTAVRISADAAFELGDYKGEPCPSGSKDSRQSVSRKALLKIAKQVRERGIRQTVPVGREATPDHDSDGGVRADRKLVDQPRLSGPALAPDDDDRRCLARSPSKRSAELFELD